MSMPLLELKNLSIVVPQGTQTRTVVQQVSFSVAAGQCVALVGESGSGKSLTGLAILQLLPLAASVVAGSSIRFQGQELLQQSEQAMRAFRGQQIAMIFQDALAAFNPVMTIGAQLQEALVAQSCDKAATYERVLWYLQRVGLEDAARCYRAYPHQLSGGMRQRAMIAMALAGGAKLLIADEPTTALDVTLQAQILALLQRLQREEGLSLLFITHDLAVAAQIAEQVVVMQAGQVVETGSMQQFLAGPTHPYAQQLLACVRQTAAPLTPDVTAPVLLTVDQLAVWFRQARRWWWQPVQWLKAVDGISLTLWAGQTHALVGESGSGKSTLARAVVRLQKPTGGHVYFEQQDEWRLSGKRLHQMHKDVQMIFQDPYTSLNPRRLVVDSLSEGLWEHRLVTSRAAMQQRVEALLQQVGLPIDSKWRYPHEFSGGERQRLCIARALAVEPKVLVLDEPTSALDVSRQQQILQLLAQLQRQLGISYLLITHDLAVVRRMAHYVSVMQQGCLVEAGPASRVLTQPQSAYTRQLLDSRPIAAIQPQEIHGDR